MEFSEETLKHFQDHIDPMLPAKGADILAACNEMEDVPAEDREAIKANLDPEKIYEDVNEILSDLGAQARGTGEEM